MNEEELKKLKEETLKRVNDPNWAREMAEFLLLMVKLDLQGEINLNKDINEKIPFFKVSRNTKGEVYHCIKFSGWAKYCKSCVFTKSCFCK